MDDIIEELKQILIKPALATFPHQKKIIYNDTSKAGSLERNIIKLGTNIICIGTVSIQMT